MQVVNGHLSFIGGLFYHLLTITVSKSKKQAHKCPSLGFCELLKNFIIYPNSFLKQKHKYVDTLSQTEIYLFNDFHSSRVIA